MYDLYDKIFNRTTGYFLTLHSEHIEVDTAPRASVGAEREAESVGAALGNSVGIVFSLPLRRLFYFSWVQIAAKKLLVKTWREI